MRTCCVQVVLWLLGISLDLFNHVSRSLRRITHLIDMGTGTWRFEITYSSFYIKLGI